MNSNPSVMTANMCNAALISHAGASNMKSPKETNGGKPSRSSRGFPVDPFVTEGKARGTGLGLAVVQQVAEQHAGCVEVGKAEGGDRPVPNN